MPRLRLLACVVGLAVLLSVVAAKLPVPARDESTRPSVRLAVLVVFDQMRGDYVEKWQPLFGPDGFRRMQEDGVWFADCQYPYATTVTGAGHASILSGVTPDRHGIIANDWYDRAAGATVNCSGSDRYEFVPPQPPPAKAADGTTPRKLVGNPDKLLAPTVGDALKAAHPKSKVFGLSLKDRSALLPVGKRPDGAYWFHGQFVTSTYYRDTLPPWVKKFNDSKTADRWFGKTWDRLRPDLDYAKLAGPDDAAGEGKGKGQGVTFPHPMGGKKEIGNEYYEAMTYSPFGNDLLLDLAKACVFAEGLGKDDVPDLLTVSFSSNDLVGHTWGPDSQEVLDVTLRSDRQMADLLRFLDENVGRGRYVVAVTADHGICPNPEAAVRQGLPGVRAELKGLQIGLEVELAKKFGEPTGGKPKTGWVEALAFPDLYFNRRAAAAHGVTVEAISLAAAEWLKTQPNVLTAYPASVIPTLDPADPLTGRVLRSHYPGRSGDVTLVLKEYVIPSDPVKGTGTTHGSPHRYDTHVPLMVYGAGVKGGRRTDPATPQHTAAILAHLLGVLPPAEQYPLPGRF